MLWKYFIYGGIALLMTGVQCQVSEVSEVSEVFVKTGSQAILSCKCVPPSPSAPAVFWTKDKAGTVWRKQRSGLEYWGRNWAPVLPGTPRVYCPHSEVGKGDYSLYISNVREEDGGNYTCRVLDGRRLVQQVVTLRVIKVSVSPSVPMLGDNVSISCDVTPWPMGANLEWKLNGRQFVPQNDKREVDSLNGDISGSVLRVMATDRLTGDWTCVVDHQGEKELATVALSVKGIVQPSSDNTKVYAAVGSAVTLPCVFSHDLIPSGPGLERLSTGSRSLSSLPASFSLSSQLPWDRSVSVSEVQPEDGGKYRCSGTVRGYKLTRDLQLVIAKIDTSTPSKKKGPMTLTCHLSDDSKVTGYEWVRVTSDLNGNQSVRSVQKGKVLKVNQAAEENSGEWACRFYGEKGVLGNVTYHIPLMSGLTGESSTAMSNNTATVIGLSLFLLVLLLILAQMYKNHQRRKKIFQYPALETIVHNTVNEREERERNRVKN